MAKVGQKLAATLIDSLQSLVCRAQLGCASLHGILQPAAREIGITAVLLELSGHCVETGSHAVKLITGAQGNTMLQRTSPQRFDTIK